MGLAITLVWSHSVDLHAEQRSYRAFFRMSSVYRKHPINTLSLFNHVTLDRQYMAEQSLLCTPYSGKPAVLSIDYLVTLHCSEMRMRISHSNDDDGMIQHTAYRIGMLRTFSSDHNLVTGKLKIAPSNETSNYNQNKRPI